MNKQAFTIGRTTSYDKEIAKHSTTKLGRDDTYPGGWVWRTAQEAEQFIENELKTLVPDWKPKDFSVYELELSTGWEVDVTKTPADDGVHNLINNAELLPRE
jgi:hypothetical protein